MSSAVTLRVVGWKKEQEGLKRASRAKTHTWFRVDVDFLEDLGHLSLEAILLLMHLRGRAAKKKSEAVTINRNILMTLLRINDGHLEKILQQLVDNQLIELCPPHYVTHITYTTDEDDDCSEPEADAPADGALPELSANPAVGMILYERHVSHAVQKTWLAAYPEPEWIASEILKAVAWEAVNPRKKKKSFPRFMAGWLARGWDSRKLPPGRGNVVSIDYSKIGVDSDSA